jgi:type I restriction enzyme R subunit
MANEADTCRKYILPKLYDAGWDSDAQIFEQHYFTDGRIVVVGKKHFRKKGKKADYLLRLNRDITLAVVEAKAEYKSPGDGMQQAKEYAQILGLHFAYSTNGKGIEEYDFIKGKQLSRDDFPTPQELWHRVKKTEDIQDEIEEDFTFPTFREIGGKKPRYYQEIAINRAVAAALKGKKRILITMATGTGKTYVAFQIIWKLWKTKRKQRILFLADRNILVDQAKDKTFYPMGDAIWKVKGQANKAREVYFAIYQAICGDQNRPSLYKEYSPDFFDLIVVDECHRGSAKDESRWREILEYFSNATQIGLTATPKRKDNVDTYNYFGNPVYSYALRDGIDDGFLAPYQVHRIVTDIDATGFRPDKGMIDRYGKEIPDKEYTTKDFERIVSLKSRTQAVAKHLADYLKDTDPLAKTIVFCVDQEHANEMRKAINNLSTEYTKDFPNYCVRVVSDEGDIGRKHLDDFQDPERDTPAKSPIVVTTSQMLTTGVDVPTCRNIVLFKPINSMTDFKQIIGRGTRLFTDKDKLWFSILDYTGATRLFADPEFDGDPELLSEEEINGQGEVVKKEVFETKPTPEEQEAIEEYERGKQPLLMRDKGEEEYQASRKYYVDDIPTSIVHEVEYQLSTDGKRLELTKLTDFTKVVVRKLFNDAYQLRKNWLDSKKRWELVEELMGKGVSMELLMETTNNSDADPLDLLVHIAFNGPIKSRRERVKSLRMHKKSFLEKYNGEARKIIEILLEKYAEHGIDELSPIAKEENQAPPVIRILNVEPLNQYGAPVEIIKYFGGRDQYLQTVEQMQRYLYLEAK